MGHDIQEYNEAIRDGFDSVRVKVKANKYGAVTEQYEMLKAKLIDSFPALDGNITFEVIPVSRSLARIISLLKYSLIAVIILTLLLSFGLFHQTWLLPVVEMIRKHRFLILLFCYMGFYVVTNIAYASAFEVYFDDTLAFSKLEKMRFPTDDDIKMLLKQYVKEKQEEKKKSQSFV